MKDYNNFSPENYKADDKLLNGLWVNLIAVALFAVFAAIVSFIYYTLWGNPFQEWSFHQRSITSNLEAIVFGGFVFVAIILGFYLVHEMLQGIIWSRYTGVRISLTRVKSMGRICYCEKPIKLRNYIFGLLLPTIILGLIPTIMGIAVGNLMIACFGLLMLAILGESFCILFLLRNTKSTDFIKPIDSKIGFTIYSPIQSA